MNVYVNVLMKSASWQIISLLRKRALFSLIPGIPQSNLFWNFLICICICIYICVSTSFSSGCPKKIPSSLEIHLVTYDQFGAELARSGPNRPSWSKMFLWGANWSKLQLALKYHIGLFLRNFRRVIFRDSLYMCIYKWIIHKCIVLSECGSFQMVWEKNLIKSIL